MLVVAIEEVLEEEVAEEEDDEEDEVDPPANLKTFNAQFPPQIRLLSPAQV